MTIHLTELVQGILFLWGFISAIWFCVTIANWISLSSIVYFKRERKKAARMVLLSPVAPIGVLVIVSTAVIAIFREAFGDGEE